MNKKAITFLILGVLFLGGFFLLTKNKFVEKNNQKIDSKKIVNRVLSARKDLPLEKVKELRLERLAQVKGIEGLNETDQYVEETAVKENNSQVNSSQISNYQTYVTPNDSAVLAVAKGKNPQQIYQSALKWVWIEDDVLNGTTEKWLLPNIFLTQTASMATNPVPGRIVSDCESQAYTLVSALRAAGMSADEVRVVTGKVNFGGIVGGHAWVEIYDKNSGWFQLEATSGDFYDTQTNKLIPSEGLPYDYFQQYQYPSIVKWAMFNDQYFFDVTRGQGVAPEIWFDEDTLKKQDNPANITYQLPDALKKLRDERAGILREELLKMDKQEFQNKIKNLRNQSSETTNSGVVSLPTGKYTSDQITSQVLLVIEQIEQAIIQGATEVQKEKFKDSAEKALEKANQMLINSNLSQEQKAEITSLLNEMENLLETGLNPGQVALLKKEALAFLDQLEEDIQSGEIQNKIQDKRDQLKNNR